MAWCKRDVSDFFRWNSFSFKSAWIFACAFQLSSTTFPCIFFAWFALCFWEKQRQNIEACTMNTTKQNKSISARKQYRRMFFYLIEMHMQKFRHFWRKKKIHLKKVTYVPLAPSHSIAASEQPNFQVGLKLRKFLCDLREVCPHALWDWVLEFGNDMLGFPPLCMSEVILWTWTWPLEYYTL